MKPIDFASDPPSLLVYETLKTYELINTDCREFSMFRLDAGAINRNYVVSDKTQKMLVKQLAKNQILPINRKRTFALQEELAILNLAPRPVFLDESESIYCEQWIEFSPQQPTDIAKTLAEALHMVHASFVSAPIIDLDLHWQTYLQLLPEISSETLSLYEKVLAKWQAYFVEYKDQFVLCHNDLHIDHVCFAHGPLLDWEYAGLGCRYFDIASCSLINQLSPRQHTDMCKIYAELANKPLQEVLDKVADINDCVAFTYELWVKAVQ